MKTRADAVKEDAGEETRAPMISFMSMKGGAGKTIGLMALASTLVERGKRIAIFEADDVRPISDWRTHALDKGTWNPDITIHRVGSVEDLLLAAGSAEAEAVDYILVDTKGGGSDLNQTLILNSQLVVVPTGLDVTEMGALFKTCNYLIELTEDAADEIPVVILLNRTPKKDGQLPVTQKMGLAALLDADMPVLEARLPRRQVHADIASAGILKRYHAWCRGRADRRLMAPEVLKAIGDAEALTDEILAVLRPGMEAA